MTTKSKSSPSTEPELFTTYEQAHATNAYSLATRWADVSARPVRVPRAAAIEAGIPIREVEHELDELATMAALRYWLDGWLPLAIHHALLAGASIGEIALATGQSPAEVVVGWQDWSAGQQRVWVRFPGFDKHRADHDRVAELLRRSVEGHCSATPAGDIRMITV